MLLIYASAHTSVENHMAPHLTQASIWHLSLIENYCGRPENMIKLLIIFNLN